MKGLEEDFQGITIIATCIIIYILGSTMKTRSEEYLALAIFMIFFISNALDDNNSNMIKIHYNNNNYVPFLWRIGPILVYIITCFVLFFHDSSNYTELTKLVDQDTNQTREEKLMEPGSAYWPIKVFGIDFIMLILFVLIVGNIYLENSNNTKSLYIILKPYIPFMLLAGTSAMLICTTTLSLPALDKIINEDSTDG